MFQSTMQTLIQQALDLTTPNTDKKQISKNTNSEESIMIRMQECSAKFWATRISLKSLKGISC